MRYTTNRTSWDQSITDLRVAPNLRGLTPKEQKIAKAIYTTLPHYRVAARELAETGWYTRGHLDYTRSVYRWDGQLVEVASRATQRRASRILEAYDDYLAGKIHADIWANYCTNGYMTRRGLYAHYDNDDITRIGKIAQSHIDVVDGGQANHDKRVTIRN